MVFGFLGGVKDSAGSALLKRFLNDRFADFGEIREVQLDLDEGKLQIKAMLKGEREPITATVERFEIQEEAGETWIVLRGFSSSREWIGRLLNRVFNGKRYKLPPGVAKFL